MILFHKVSTWYFSWHRFIREKQCKDANETTTITKNTHTELLVCVYGEFRKISSDFSVETGHQEMKSMWAISQIL